MSDLLIDNQDGIYKISFNRLQVHNAFDDVLLQDLHHALDEAMANSQVKVIMLKAKGKHFSSGADLNWMQRMAHFDYEANFQDALILARLMHALYFCKKPTLALVQGAAYGGGVGLVAACDLAIASNNACFCFSEVKLGLIPAVISPFIVKAMGERQAKYLFMTAQPFNAKRAYELGLIHEAVTEEELESVGQREAERLASLPPEALFAAKTLVQGLSLEPIENALLEKTAELIAMRRSSLEGQRGLMQFLNRQKPRG